LLERWDRHNQRILDYHNALAGEPPRPWGTRRVTLLVAAWLVTRVVAELAFDSSGAWAATALGALGVVALIISGVIQRRKRLAWEARRGQSPPEA